MTNDEMRVAIAESVGWKYAHIQESAYIQSHVPDYCNDLNAMHEAESTIFNSDVASKYAYELHKIVHSPEMPTNHNFCINCFQLLLHATATQRAEAFLRTIGKWRAE